MVGVENSIVEIVAVSRLVGQTGPGTQSGCFLDSLNRSIMAPCSKDAIYSGYLMSVDNFKQLCVSLKPEYANFSLLSHVPKSDNWRLRLPKAERAKVPKLKCT